MLQVTSDLKKFQVNFVCDRDLLRFLNHGRHRKTQLQILKEGVHIERRPPMIINIRSYRLRS